MGLEVIGAGVGRTGTTSLKVALEQLGLGPCYHMF
jgi:Sulfotransferase domain